MENQKSLMELILPDQKKVQKELATLEGEFFLYGNEFTSVKEVFIFKNGFHSDKTSLKKIEAYLSRLLRGRASAMGFTFERVLVENMMRDIVGVAVLKKSFKEETMVRVCIDTKVGELSANVSVHFCKKNNQVWTHGSHLVFPFVQEGFEDLYGEACPRYMVIVKTSKEGTES